MKKNYIVLIILCCNFFKAQTYPSQNINLLSLITPNTVNSGVDGRRYSGCWGWFQSSKNKEYAICGTSNGTYFIDVSAPTSPTISAFVQGKLGCTWREIKTYQNYCYISSDDASPNTFQIVDMQYLPDSVHMINNSKQYVERTHAMWIDGDKLYTSGVTYSTGLTSPMNIYSLATPTAPVLLRELSQDISNSVINYVHDMYARNDTIFASCGNQGIHVLKYNAGLNTFTQLGNYLGYQGAGYNHSSFLTQNAKYLVFCDEAPAALPIHLVDVQNLSNISPVQSFKPYTNTTPHNPYLIGNNIAIVSCYEDGVNIYNISQPANICLTGYFDTYPQFGGNQPSYSGQTYRGNWGAYPYLPSGILLANDMQNGLFILNPTAAYTNTTCIPLTVNKNTQINNSNLIFYPNPASNKIAVNYSTNGNILLQIKTIFGQLVFEKSYNNIINDYITTENLANGSYVIIVSETTKTTSKKLIVNH